MFCDGALQDILRMCIAGIFYDWAHLLYIGYSLVGYCEWALQGYLVVGHYRDIWWLVTKVNFQSGEDNIYFKIYQLYYEGRE